MFDSWKNDLVRVQDPYGPNSQPFNVDPTRDIPGVMVTGAWHTGMSKYLVEQDVRGLYLNSARGFRCDDYSFLRELPQLELLSMMPPSITTLGRPVPITELRRLKRLSANFAIRESIDFRQLTDLRSCVLKWNTRIKSVFDTQTLKWLHLYSLKRDWTEQLGRLTTLKHLELSFSGIQSLSDLTPLRGLEMLVFEVCRNLENLEGVDAFPNLKCLSLTETRKISSLECLRPLTGLEVLTIDDCGEIESLAPLAELRNLKAISFSGAQTTICDGDLAPLTKLPKLSMLMFGPRRHYSHKLVKTWNWNNFGKADQLLVSK